MLMIAAAQLGPIPRNEPRRVVVARLMELMREAHAMGCRIVVYPEVALTAFFPHWWIESDAELDGYFEAELPGPETQPLFDLARHLGMGFCLGYAELATEDGSTRRYNS